MLGALLHADDGPLIGLVSLDHEVVRQCFASLAVSVCDARVTPVLRTIRLLQPLLPVSAAAEDTPSVHFRRSAAPGGLGA